jgi:von Willebrand factor A domain-containing protein 7
MWHRWNRRDALAIGAIPLALMALTTTPAAAFPGTDTIRYAGVSLPAGAIAHTHESITGSAVHTAVRELFGSGGTAGVGAALDEIVRANAAVDDDQTHAAPHFDGESFPEGQLRLLTLRQQVRVDLRAGQISTARTDLGRALHTLQDFYSHSNWVELGHGSPNQDLGRPGHTLTRLPADIQKCSGSTLRTSGLTSGYYPGEDRTAGSGACRHGGLLDSASRFQGINKDTRNPLLSPHSANHELAAGVATAATVQFLHDLAGDLTASEVAVLLGVS